MLQIKKTTLHSSVSYTAQFLLRNKIYNTSYTLQKKKQVTTYVRAPKHFNIGKQRITSLNYKLINVCLPTKHGLNLKSFLLGNSTLFFSLSKKLQWNTYVFPRSLKITIHTKFCIKWLEF